MRIKNNNFSKYGQKIWDIMGVYYNCISMFILCRSFPYKVSLLKIGYFTNETISRQAINHSHSKSVLKWLFDRSNKKYDIIYDMSEWKEIKNFEKYLISSDGEVYNTQTKKILKKNGCGCYYIIFLYQNKIKEKFYIHRLVAQAFIPNPNHKKVVNHINGNKKDNRVENLEWATQSENMKHAIATGLIKTKRSKKKIRFISKKGFMIKRTTKDGHILFYNNIYEIRNATDMTLKYIQFLISRKTSTNEKWEIIKI